MKRILFAAIVLTWVNAGYGDQTQGKDLDQGLMLFKVGKWQEAINILEKVVSRDDLLEGDELQVRKYLGMAYSLLSQKSKAIREYKRLIIKDPDFTIEDLKRDSDGVPSGMFPAVIGNFSLALMEKIDDEMSGLLFEEAELASSELQAARVLFDEGEWEQAATRLKEFVKKNRLANYHRDKALKTLAVVHVLLGQEDEAVGVYKELMLSFPVYSEQPSFLVGMFGYGAENSPEQIHKVIGRAVMEYREEEYLAKREQMRLGKTRSGAMLRSIVLPGWGQRYMRYHRRSNVFVALVTYSLAAAVFDGSNISRGIAAGLWSFNVLDAAFISPNIIVPTK